MAVRALFPNTIAPREMWAPYYLWRFVVNDGQAGSNPSKPDSHHYFRLADAWCLWCLFEAESGAIYAEQLKGLQKARS